MPNLHVTLRNGESKLITADSNMTVMEAIRNQACDEILALCGGCCSCATCHVYVDEKYVEFLSPMSTDEDDLLDSIDNRKSTSRLSCQIIVTDALDGMTLEVAPEE